MKNILNVNNFNIVVARVSFKVCFEYKKIKQTQKLERLLDCASFMHSSVHNVDSMVPMDCVYQQSRNRLLEAANIIEWVKEKHCKILS